MWGIYLFKLMINKKPLAKESSSKLSFLSKCSYLKKIFHGWIYWKISIIFLKVKTKSTRIIWLNLLYNWSYNWTYKRSKHWSNTYMKKRKKYEKKQREVFSWIFLITIKFPLNWTSKKISKFWKKICRSIVVI